MSPRRRSVLCALGVGLTAGCLRAANDASRGTGTKTSPEGPPDESTPTDAGEQTETEPVETEPLDASATRLWEAPYGVGFGQRHVHVDGGLLVGTLADTFALLEYDGTVRWTQSAGRASDETQTQPTRAGDVVLYGGQHAMLGLDAATGEVRWQTPLPVETDTSSFVETRSVAGPGVALVGINYTDEEGEDRATLAGFDTETGDLLWHRPHAEIAADWDAWLGVQSLSPPIAGRTIVGGWNNSFWVDIETGTFGESTAAGARHQSVLRDGVLYLTDAGRLQAYSVSGETVSRQWEFEPLGRTSSGPTVADGTVYVTADDTGVYAVEDGQRVWRYQADNTVQTAPAATGDTVWAGERKLHMVDRASGAGRVVTEEREPQAFSADGDVAFVSTESGTAAYRRQS